MAQSHGKSHSSHIISVDPIVQSFVRYHRVKKSRPATIEQYTKTLQLFRRFCIEEGMPELIEVSRDHIQSWLLSLQETHASASVQTYYRHLKAFYNWLVKEDEIAKSPMARIPEPAVDETEKDIVAPVDVARLLKKLEKEKRWRDASVIAIFYDTGIRAGELANLKTEDVDLDTGIATIRSETAKGRRIKKVRLSDKAVRYIDRYLRKQGKRTEYLIIGRIRQPMTRITLSRLVKRCFAEVGVKATITSHDLRHTWASEMEAYVTESEFMALAGWKSPNMVRHYARKAIERNALEAHRRASPLERLGR